MVQTRAAPDAGRRAPTMVWCSVAAITLAAAALRTALPVPAAPFLAGRPLVLTVAGLLLLFALTEVFSVHLHFARNTHSFSVVEIPLTLGLFFLPVDALVATHIIGGGAALLLHRKQQPVKLLFNVASFALVDQLAAAVFRAVAPDRGLGAAAMAAAALGTLLASLVSAGLVVLVIRLAEGPGRDDRLLHSMLVAGASAAVAASLGLIAAGMIAAYPYATWVLLVPTAGLYLTNRSFAAGQRRHQGFELLHDSTTLLNESTDLEGPLAQFVRRASEAFGAGFAELVYLHDDRALDVVVGASGAVEAHHVVRHPAVAALLDDMAGQRPQLLTKGTGPASSGEFLDVCGLVDAAVAPLRDGSRTLGMLVVGNGHGAVARFDPNDLVVLATLAANVVAALENDRLEQSVDRLQVLEQKLTHQATHDTLTGLANRALFDATLADALAMSPKDDPRVGVLFIDLDDFKAVNDSLGHAAGDEMLVMLARRLRNALPGDATAARLGGDEFAVVLPTDASTATVGTIADRVLQSLGAPLAIQGNVVPVKASIGGAVSLAGQDAASVLRDADAAMYRAKRLGKHQVVLFEQPGAGDHAPHGITSGDLDLALLRDHLSVHLQPVVRVASGSICSAEALVRWHHDTLGTLAPEAFLGLACRSGLLGAIRAVVLDRSCAFLVELGGRAGDERLRTVSVNLAEHELDDPGLLGGIARTLARHGVAPDRLAVEVPAGALIDPSPNRVSVVNGIAELGCPLVVDDAGAGYWSLATLAGLQVAAFKLSPELTDDLGRPGDEIRRTMVRAVCVLADALGAVTIAKGIERVGQVDVLRELGVDRAQGHFFAHPVEPRELLLRAADVGYGGLTAAHDRSDSHGVDTP